MPAAAKAVPFEAADAACPLCDRPADSVFLSADEIAHQLRARDRFFARRIDRRVVRDRIRDVTDVVLGTPAAILRCVDCGALVRDDVPGEEVFCDDDYGDGVLEALHRAHFDAFRRKESDYRALLPRNARVVEVGCYAGGFLAAAAEWGWNAIGTDIGRDAVRFCRARGFDARSRPLHECELDAHSCDAVFVWNCFEQIADPRPLLDETDRVLRDAGLLVLRVPDAVFYVRYAHEETALAILAYNGLLGWPHRYGYDAATLRRLAERHRFTLMRVLRRPALRPFRDAMHAWARDEETAIIGDVNHGWLELTFAKARR